MFFKVKENGKIINKAFYSVLGVSKNVTNAEIRDAYRQQLLSCHPDKGGTDVAVQEDRIHEI